MDGGEPLQIIARKHPIVPGETLSQRKLRIQRERRAASGNSHTKKYEKTKRGFLMRAYRNMLSRVTGIQKKKAHIYLGLPILPREQFYEWAMGDPKFHAMFAEWELNHHDINFTPSVDRINSKRGYEPDNIQWLTHKENSEKARKEKAH